MTYEEALQTIPCGRYRHFKGKEYEVIGIARHSEDESPMVRRRKDALYAERAEHANTEVQIRLLLELVDEMVKDSLPEWMARKYSREMGKRPEPAATTMTSSAARGTQCRRAC